MDSDILAGVCGVVDLASLVIQTAAVRPVRDGCRVYLDTTQ